MAMGNLYRQKLQDYTRAAECYRVVVDSHTDSPHLANACVQLSACYQQLGEVLKANHLHKRMIKLFPPESQEYLFAKEQLGL